MYNTIIPPVKKRFLFTGDMQSGKTSDLVRRILKSLEENENIVEVIINYNTNASMDSTNQKLREKGGQNLKIWSGREGLDAMKYQIQYNKLDRSKHHVISLIAHYASVDKLNEIIGLWSTKYNPGSPVFNMSIDEDDSLALDHSKKKIIVLKQDRIQAAIEHPLVGIVRNITATPFANHFSETDFDKIIRVPHGEGYVGLEKILRRADISTFNQTDIKSLYSLEPTKNMIDWVNADFEGVSLIQITSTKVTQALIVQNLKNICPNSVIALSNSDKGQYTYYVNGKAHGNMSTSFDHEMAFSLARTAGYKKVFIVAYYLSDRTNTFRASDGIFNNMRTLFDSSSSTHDETLIQRIGRSCGYPLFGVPQVFCTEECYTTLMRALDTHLDFMALEEETPNINKADARHRAMIDSGKLKEHNVKHCNGSKSLKKGDYGFSKHKVEPLLSTKAHSTVDDTSIDMSNTNLKTNSKLYKYLCKKHNVFTMLNVEDTDGDIKRRQVFIRPNIQRGNVESTQSLILFTGGRNYTIIVQYCETFPTLAHSIHTFEEDTFAVYSVKGGQAV